MRKNMFPAQGGGPSKQSLITSMDLKIKSLLGDLPLVGQESRYDSDAAYITEIEVETEDAGAFLHQPMVENEDDFSTVLGEEIIDIPLEEHNYNAVKHNHSEQHPTTSGSLSVIKNSKAQLDSNKPAVQIYDKQFSVNKLKCKTSSPLKFKRKPTKSVLDRSVAGKKIETFSEAKSELIQLQKELAQKQLYFSEEEHKLKMKNLKLIEEKHLKKIKLIDLKIKNEEMKMKCVKETFNIL
ncbi:uncharacterized protein LOC128982849 [Macrosteles quadrilineatus]|uniref:uncharacterized protein LOC128982849 n=1 Tax=Macrosteles quadrilineatus TaxID=74068 RepID=UPI0023E0C74D|nr:uncharacterized protein LOC128982849 [Macrosteles quadrilineatus]